jgi:predicted RNA binding protein YcfA (HicA-like mRNA interferase family)
LKWVSGKRLCKALERAGWQRDRINGSHHVYSKPGVATLVSVPVHGNKTLAKGLQHRLMKDAGLTEQDL